MLCVSIPQCLHSNEKLEGMKRKGIACRICRNQGIMGCYDWF